MIRREFSAGGIVILKMEEGIKVLLIKDRYGHWTWPKGNIEKGESSKEAAIREIKEEVGIENIKIIEKLGQVQYFYRLKGALRLKTVYLYICETKDSNLKTQKLELEDAKWFIPQEAIKRIEYKGAKDLLEKAISKYLSIKNVHLQ